VTSNTKCIRIFAAAAVGPGGLLLNCQTSAGSKTPASVLKTPPPAASAFKNKDRYSFIISAEVWYSFIILISADVSVRS
jgi:hypothetical protein